MGQTSRDLSHCLFLGFAVIFISIEQLESYTKFGSKCSISNTRWRGVGCSEVTDHFRISVVNTVNVYISFMLALERAGALSADSCHTDFLLRGKQSSRVVNQQCDMLWLRTHSC